MIPIVFAIEGAWAMFKKKTHEGYIDLFCYPAITRLEIIQEFCEQNGYQLLGNLDHFLSQKSISVLEEGIGE